jgi:hypothetical protein
MGNGKTCKENTPKIGCLIGSSLFRVLSLNACFQQLTAAGFHILKTVEGRICRWYSSVGIRGGRLVLLGSAYSSRLGLPRFLY